MTVNAAEYLGYEFSKDIVWVLVSTRDYKYITVDKDVPQSIGSQSALMKSVSSVKTSKDILECLEVFPLPPGDDV